MFTTEQLATLKAWVDANAASVFDQSTVDLLNTPASPTFFVWKTNVEEQDITTNTFDWTRVDNLSVGKARIWDWMFRDSGVNPSNPAIRAGIIEAWKGTQADLDVRLVVWGHCQEAATVAEKLFANGNGTAAIVDGTGPATRVFVGQITLNDLISAERGFY